MSQIGILNPERKYSQIKMKDPIENIPESYLETKKRENYPKQEGEI